MKIRCFSCNQKLDVSDVPPLTSIACPVCQADMVVPKVFGDLLLEKEIGSGLLSTVYKGMDVALDREVAVKVLKEEHKGVRSDFIKAARAVSSLSNPHVLPIYSCGEVEGSVFLIMQYMPGRSLERRLHEEKELLPVTQTVAWLGATTRALASAREREIPHLDIIPANLLLDLDGNLKVADFGLANLIMPKGPIDSEAFDALLQPPRAWYLAPERVTTGQQGLAMDMHGLGATFYHAICGQPPFPGATLHEIMQRCFAGPPKDPRELRSEIPAPLATLLLRMLTLTPTERPGDYGDVLEVVADLETARRSPRQAPTTRSHRRKKLVVSPRNQPIPVLNPQSALSSLPAPTPPRPPLVTLGLWLWRLVPIILAIILVALILGHATHAAWYTKWIRPHLPVQAQEAPYPSPAPESSAPSASQ